MLSLKLYIAVNTYRMMLYGVNSIAGIPPVQLRDLLFGCQLHTYRNVANQYVINV